VTVQDDLDLLAAAHSNAMEALAADVHPHSAIAIRDWDMHHAQALARVRERIEQLERFRDERIDLWHCTLEDKRKMDEGLLRAERERDEARERIEQLEAALVIHERLTEAAEAYCWNATDETLTALKDARARWQSELGMHRLRLLRLATSQDGEQR
jgi:hypothetical protein